MIEPAKISELTQVQRNALTAALGCKTIHRMTLGDSLPAEFEPDEIVIDCGIFETNTLAISLPTGYLVNDAVMEIIGAGLEPYGALINQGGSLILINEGDFLTGDLVRFDKRSELKLDQTSYDAELTLFGNGTGGCSLVVFCKKES